MSAKGRLGGGGTVDGTIVHRGITQTSVLTCELCCRGRESRGPASAYGEEAYVAEFGRATPRQSYALQSNLSAARRRWTRGTGLAKHQKRRKRPVPPRVVHATKFSFHTDSHHGAGRSSPYGERDSRALDGRRREGEIRPSRPADGLRRSRDRAVHPVPEIRRRQAGLAGPRPLRAVGRPRLDAALFAAVSDRQSAR